MSRRSCGTHSKFWVNNDFSQVHTQNWGAEGISANWDTSLQLLPCIWFDPLKFPKDPLKVVTSPTRPLKISTNVSLDHGSCGSTTMRSNIGHFDNAAMFSWQYSNAPQQQRSLLVYKQAWILSYAGNIWKDMFTLIALHIPIQQEIITIQQCSTKIQQFDQSSSSLPVTPAGV